MCMKAKESSIICLDRVCLLHCQNIYKEVLDLQPKTQLCLLLINTYLVSNRIHFHT